MSVPKPQSRSVTCSCSNSMVSCEHDTLKINQMLCLMTVVLPCLYVCCVLELGYSTESLYTIVPPGQVYRVAVSGTSCY